MSVSSPLKPLRALLVEDDENDTALLCRHLRKQGYALEYRHVCNVQDYDEALRNETWDVVISDFKMPGFSAQEALGIAQRRECDTPFIVVSGTIDEETACEMMQAGAQDYLSKDRLDRLAPVIERERREAQMRRERRTALETMRTSEARFRAMAANVPGVLFQWVVRADGHLEFRYVSEASQMLLGLSADTLLQHPDGLLELVLPDDRASFTEALMEASARQTTMNWEGRIQVADIDVKWINIRCSPRAEGDGTTLWEGVMWNITQSKLAEQELRESRTQLAELSEHLQQIKEQERDRIARDIHDVLGGTLVGIKISTSLLAAKIEGDEALKARIRDIEKMLDDAITTAGRVARELRPGILKEFGLAAAVESYAEDFEHRTHIPCEVLCADHDIETNDNTALALFRTYQEALTNVSKHAAASRVQIRLVQEGDDIVLEVIDNGRGIGSEDLRKPKSFGLRSIRERLNTLGGAMDIRVARGGGTVVALRAPVKQTNADA